MIRASGIASASGVARRSRSIMPATSSPVKPWNRCARSAEITTISTSPRRTARAEAPHERRVGVQRDVAAAEQHDAGHAITADRDSSATGLPKLVGSAARNPRWPSAARALADGVDLVERGVAQREVTGVTGQGEDRRLGEARVRAAVGQADVAAGEAQARDRDDAAVDDEHVRPRAPRGRATCSGAAWRRARRRPAPGARGRAARRPTPSAAPPGRRRGRRRSCGRPRRRRRRRCSAASASRRGAVRAMSVRRAPAGSRARSLVTAVPTLPVAPTTAMCGARCARDTRGSSIRIWSSTIAAVKALPLVTAMSVRSRSVAPPAVTVAVRAPRPTTSAPSAAARSTARLTRRRPPSTSDSRCRAPNGTSTTWPTRSPPICTPAIVTGGSGRRRSAAS